MFICTIIHILICLIRKDCSNFQLLIFRGCVIQLFELVIILSKGLNLIHCEQRCINIFALGMYMLLMMFKNMLCNSCNTLIIMIQWLHINFMTLAVLRIIQLSDPSMKKAEELRVRDIIGSKYPAVRITVTMDALLESAMNQNFIPVIDDLDNFIGIVTRRDIISYLAKENENSFAPPVSKIG